jgi:large subunit ribosomal protein L24
MNAKKKMGIKSGDTVVVITGKQAPQTVDGKKTYTTGKVNKAFPQEGRVIVEGVNMVTVHQKPRGQGLPGGIIRKEAPIDASNVMLLCPKCNKATRIAYKILEDGKKVRVCKKCNATFEN